jgi:thioesterase domain-containing protein
MPGGSMSHEERRRLVRELQATLEHEIPLTRHLGLHVEEFEDGTLVVRAPLEPNINHKATAFAGSLNAVCTLTGWGLIWLLLRERGLRSIIVIQEGTTHYHLPVRDDFTAICHMPPPETVETFLTTLARRGRARLPLAVEIRAGERLAVAFSARYVVTLRP